MSSPDARARRGLLRGRSLWTKSVALVGGYALFLSAVYGGFTAFLVRREVAAANERLQQTARLVAAEIDAHLDVGQQRLTTVAGLPGLVHGLERMEKEQTGAYIPPWTTLHYLFFKSSVFTGGVFLLDRDGKVLWTEPPGLPWLGTTLAGDPTIAAMYRNPTEPVSAGVAGDLLLPAPHVVMAVPIEGPDGRVDGLLGGVIDLSAGSFTRILRAVSTAEGRYLSVVDQQSRVISSTDAGPLLRPTVAPSEESAVLASAPLGRAPWQVVAGEPRETALAPIWQLQRLLAAIGGTMLLVALGVGSRAIGGFVGVIHRLTRSAEVMARGDLSEPVVVDHRHPELATLGSTFERMRTELQRSQASLTQRLAEREELIQLKEEFLANVSHELRTPLNVIFGYTEVLLDDERDAERRDALERIRTQSEQLLALLRDLMTLSGLNAGKIGIELSPVTPAEVVGRLRPLADQLAHGRPITAIFDHPAHAPVLYTDRLRLEQVLTNLLTNAFKFTKEGVVALRVRYAASDRRAVFEVSDTGIGIPAEELPQVFDEFRQVDGSMSRQHGGVGLGLALVRRLVDLLGGEVSVASRPGEGSTFTVVLPVEHPSAATPTPPPEAQRTRNRAAVVRNVIDSGRGDRSEATRT